MLRADSWLMRGTLLLGLVGCSGAEAPRQPTADSRRALSEFLTAMSTRCPERQAGSGQPSTERDQLFVEVAILDVPSAVAAATSLANLQDLSQSLRVQLVGVPHVIVDFEHEAEIVTAPNDAADQRLSGMRLSMLPHRADGVVVLDMKLALNSPSSNVVAASSVPLTFSATARQNELTLARVEWDAASRRSLLLLFKTFEVRGEQDLRAIFECKMQQRAEALRRAGASPP